MPPKSAPTSTTQYEAATISTNPSAAELQYGQPVASSLSAAAPDVTPPSAISPQQYDLMDTGPSITHTVGQHGNAAVNSYAALSPDTRKKPSVPALVSSNLSPGQYSVLGADSRAEDTYFDHMRRVPSEPAVIGTSALGAGASRYGLSERTHSSDAATLVAPSRLDQYASGVPGPLFNDSAAAHPQAPLAVRESSARSANQGILDTATGFVRYPDGTYLDAATGITHYPDGSYSDPASQQLSPAASQQQPRTYTKPTGRNAVDNALDGDEDTDEETGVARHAPNQITDGYLAYRPGPPAPRAPAAPPVPPPANASGAGGNGSEYLDYNPNAARQADTALTIASQPDFARVQYGSATPPLTPAEINCVQRVCAYLRISTTHWLYRLSRFGFSIFFVGVAIYLSKQFSLLAAQRREYVLQNPDNMFEFFVADGYTIDSSALNSAVLLFTAAYPTFRGAVFAGLDATQVFCGDFSNIAKQIAVLFKLKAIRAVVEWTPNPFGPPCGINITAPWLPTWNTTIPDGFNPLGMAVIGPHDEAYNDLAILAWMSAVVLASLTFANPEFGDAQSRFIVATVNLIAVSMSNIGKGLAWVLKQLFTLFTLCCLSAGSNFADWFTKQMDVVMFMLSNCCGDNVDTAFHAEGYSVLSVSACCLPLEELFLACNWQGAADWYKDKMGTSFEDQLPVLARVGFRFRDGSTYPGIGEGLANTIREMNNEFNKAAQQHKLTEDHVFGSLEGLETGRKLHRDSVTLMRAFNPDSDYRGHAQSATRPSLLGTLARQAEEFRDNLLLSSHVKNDTDNALIVTEGAKALKNLTNDVYLRFWRQRTPHLIAKHFEHWDTKALHNLTQADRENALKKFTVDLIENFPVLFSILITHDYDTTIKLLYPSSLDKCCSKGSCMKCREAPWKSYFRAAANATYSAEMSAAAGETLRTLGYLYIGQKQTELLAIPTLQERELVAMQPRGQHPDPAYYATPLQETALGIRRVFPAQYSQPQRDYQQAEDAAYVDIAPRPGENDNLNYNDPNLFYALATYLATRGSYDDVDGNYFTPAGHNDTYLSVAGRLDDSQSRSRMSYAPPAHSAHRNMTARDDDDNDAPEFGFGVESTAPLIITIDIEETRYGGDAVIRAWAEFIDGTRVQLLGQTDRTQVERTADATIERLTFGPSETANAETTTTVILRRIVPNRNVSDTSAQAAEATPLLSADDDIQRRRSQSQRSITQQKVVSLDELFARETLEQLKILYDEVANEAVPTNYRPKIEVARSQNVVNNAKGYYPKDHDIIVLHNTLKGVPNFFNLRGMSPDKWTMGLRLYHYCQTHTDTRDEDMRVAHAAIAAYVDAAKTPHYGQAVDQLAPHLSGIYHILLDVTVPDEKKADVISGLSRLMLRQHGAFAYRELVTSASRQHAGYFPAPPRAAASVPTGLLVDMQQYHSPTRSFAELPISEERDIPTCGMLASG